MLVDASWEIILTYRSFDSYHLLLQNNVASRFGGGIAFEESPGITLTISSTTISGNKVIGVRRIPALHARSRF